MEPQVWGPSGWSLMHWTALHADSAQGSQIAWASWVDSFLRGLPCEACQKHAMDYWKASRFDPAGPKASAFEWTVHFHNSVNERLGKPRVTLDNARALWATDKRGQCMQACAGTPATHTTNPQNSKVHDAHSSTVSYVIVVVLLVGLAWSLWTYREALESSATFKAFRERVSKATSSWSAPKELSSSDLA